MQQITGRIEFIDGDMGAGQPGQGLGIGAILPQDVPIKFHRLAITAKIGQYAGQRQQNLAIVGVEGQGLTDQPFRFLWIVQLLLGVG